MYSIKLEMCPLQHLQTPNKRTHSFSLPLALPPLHRSLSFFLSLFASTSPPSSISPPSLHFSLSLPLSRLTSWFSLGCVDVRLTAPSPSAPSPSAHHQDSSVSPTQWSMIEIALSTQHKSIVMERHRVKSYLCACGYIRTIQSSLCLLSAEITPSALPITR